MYITSIYIYSIKGRIYAQKLQILFSKIQTMIHTALCKHNRKDNVKIYEYMFSISRSKNVGNIPKIESLFTFYIAV